MEYMHVEDTGKKLSYTFGREHACKNLPTNESKSTFPVVHKIDPSSSHRRESRSTRTCSESPGETFHFKTKNRNMTGSNESRLLTCHDSLGEKRIGADTIVHE
jgi:hypothetical protein